MLWTYTKKLLRFWHHQPREFWLLPRLCVSLMLISSLAKISGLPTLFRCVAHRSSRFSTSGLPPDELVALVDRLLSKNVWIFTPTCWKRAILLHRYLTLQGLRTQVVFGVRKDENELLAGHAWLEWQGHPLYELEKPDYVKTVVW